MKIRVALITALVLIGATVAFGQENKMVQFQLAILKRGPKWEATAQKERDQILHQHLRNVISMLKSGQAVIAGPFGGDTDTAGLVVLRAASAEEAKGWAAADPAVKAELFVSELHPWWSEDIFKKAASPLKLTTVYLGFLKRGPNRKEGDSKTPEVQELQKAHMANINRLAEMKKLVMAGPFGDDGDLRGIFVFRVGSMKEAEELTATDPMIKIKRLVLELYPWQVPDGVIP